ncbi:MAG: hypothetical protein F4015_12365 [Acidimicrobiia bacterium]|nr:hypothetical protein [Acidimicrobiia bacterium]
MESDGIWTHIGVGPCYLGGLSPNAHWHVPRALHSLLGEVDTACWLVNRMAPQAEHRLQTGHSLPEEIGTVTICITSISAVAERAIKTLAAQTQPTAPKRTHKLAVLFNGLDAATKSAVREEFGALPRLWQDEYLSNSDTVDGILETANTNFVDWRYTMEPKATEGGIPKPLLAVCAATTLVGIRMLREWQKANGLRWH